MNTSSLIRAEINDWLNYRPIFCCQFLYQELIGKVGLLNYKETVVLERLGLYSRLSRSGKLKTQIFFSHSGSKSRSVAEIIYSWLRSLVPFATLWMSNHDIYKGDEWDEKIKAALHLSSTFLVFLTTENKGSGWPIFEVGFAEALGVQICPILIDIPHSEVEIFFANYQHTTLRKDEIKNLVISINNNLNVCNLGLPQEIVEEYFELKWPELKNKLTKMGIM